MLLLSGKYLVVVFEFEYSAQLIIFLYAKRVPLELGIHRYLLREASLYDLERRHLYKALTAKRCTDM